MMSPSRDGAFSVAAVLAQGWSNIERALIYRPSPLSNDALKFPKNFPVEDAWFSAKDGTRLHGLFVPCPEPRAVILFAHGAKSNVASLEEKLHRFCRRHHATVMIFDYRGYGRSEGIPTEQGLYQDARAARQWLALRTGVTPQEVVLMGRSLGAAVVVDLAANDGAAGLILESAFTSLPALVQHHACGVSVQWMVAPQFDSLRKILNYHGPLLISHGDADCLIPYEHGQQLCQDANHPKMFVRIPDGRHQDPQTEEYHQALDELLLLVGQTTE